jgi:ankyrin repeat protein
VTALAFSYRDAAEALVRRGARVATVAAAAGLGRLDDVRRLIPAAGPEERHRALALAAQLGHVDIVRLLLDAGEDPDRYNPQGLHAHATPLHQAVWAGHEPVVRLLVERGARLDVKDTLYEGTPLGWAEYGGRAEIAAYLRSRGQAAGA